MSHNQNEHSSHNVAADANNAHRGHFKRWRMREQCSFNATNERENNLTKRLLAIRGITDNESIDRFLTPKLTDLHDPRLLPGCEKAAARLVNAVRANEPIVIYGDYDVDGVTATAILFHIVKAARQDALVTTYVPHRIDEGYGLNPQAIDNLCSEGARVIISVDCGITAVESAQQAVRQGVDLIITDHHQFGDELPEAFALVHPRLPAPNPYPFADLCGAGVAYKLAWQFARHWCDSDQVSQTFRQTLVDLLPLAALGTIADVVPLLEENRIIASHGLGRIKHAPWVGLNALIDQANLRSENIDAYHVGFSLGPRLNACGRMGHAAEAVKLLTDASAPEAAEIAARLHHQNERRRAIERDIFQQACEKIEQNGMGNPECRVIVLADESWHSGVIGIVCSRLVGRFARPVVMLTLHEEQWHGSARSIDGFNIHNAFASCAQHLLTFGGHAMAAGLKLRADSLEHFRHALSDYATQHISVDALTPSVDIDTELSLAELDLKTIQQVERMKPFGCENPAPTVLIPQVKVRQPARAIGRNAEHLSFIAAQGARMIRCVGWRMGCLAHRLPAGSEIDLVAEPGINHFNGRTNVELTVQDLRWRTGISA